MGVLALLMIEQHHNGIRFAAAVWLAAGLLLLGLLPTGCSPPSDLDDVDDRARPPSDQPADADWDDVRKELREQAYEIAVQRATESVDPEAVARQLGLSWPVESPDETRAQVRERLEARLAETVEERYPHEHYLRIRETVEEQHPVKSVGDTVSFVIRQGRGSAPNVQGAFRDINPTHVRIGDRWILRSDMEERDLAMFDPEIRQDLVDRVVRRESALYTEKREAYADSLRRDLYLEGFRKAGYVYYDRSFIAAAELLRQTVAAEIERSARRLQPEVEREVFDAAGFVFRDGEWQPSAVQRTLRRLRGGGS